MGRKRKLRAAKGKASGLGVAKGKKKSAKSKSKSPSQQYSVEDLMIKVEECLDSFQYDLACKFCERALQIEPNSIQVLNTYAPLLLETGDTDRAVECFKRCVELSPDEGHAKYLYLGQMASGEEAIALLTKGIEIMSQSLDASEGVACEGVEGASVMVVEGKSVTREELSSAYCSLAEVYLTDSCFADDAGKKCYECCSKAVELSPSNPEAFQLMASCLLSQQKTEDAKAVAMKGVALWLPSNKSKHSETTSHDTDPESHDPGEAMPPYFSRVSTAKLLIELQEYDLAHQVLEGCLHDDDEVVGVWYLMGWLYVLCKDADSARFYLEQAQTLFSKLGCDEEDMLEHISELLKELGPSEDQPSDPATMEDELERGEDESEDEDRTTSMDVS